MMRLIIFLFFLIPFTVHSQCDPVTGLAVTSITSSSATVSFTTPSTSVYFVIKYSDGVTDYRQNINNPGGPFPALVTAPLTNLDELTGYTVTIMRYCTVSDSAETSEVDFETLEGQCDTVTSIIVTTTNSTATITSSEAEYGDSYIIQYIRQGATDTLDDVGADADFSLIGLKPASNYYYRIGTICGTDTLYNSFRIFLTKTSPAYTPLANYGAQSDRLLAKKVMNYPAVNGEPSVTIDGKNDFPSLIQDTTGGVNYYFNPKTQRYFKEGVDVVANIAELKAHKLTPNRIFVKDSLRGGNFTLQYIPGTAEDGGVYFDADSIGTDYYWVRETSPSYGYNVRWWGADADSTTDDAAAFDACADFIGNLKTANYTRIRGTNAAYMYIPGGPQYTYGGSGIGGNFGGAFNIVGDGLSQTRIKITSDIYFIDDSVNSRAFRIAHLQVIGGKGFYRNRFPNTIGGNASGVKIIEWCAFIDFTVCAISSNSRDDAMYKITNCKFTGTNASKAIFMPGGGGHLIADNWFAKGQYYIHCMNGGGVNIRHNNFNGIGVHSEVRADIWLEPKLPTSGTPNNGRNATIELNTFGNENDDTADRFILIAISDTSTNVNHTTSPDYGSYKALEAIIDNREYPIKWVTIQNNIFSSDNGVYQGIITSWTPFVGSWTFRENIIQNTSRYIFEFKGIDHFDSATTLPQTNYVSMSKMDLKISKVTLCNIPGFAQLDDPNHVLREASGELPLSHIYDYNYVNFITSAEDTLTVISSTAIKSYPPVYGADDRLSAHDVKFLESEGRVRNSFTLTNATPGQMCWVQFDVAPGDDSTISEIYVRIGNAYNVTIKRWVYDVPATGWKTFTAPFMVYETTTPLNLIIAASDRAYTVDSCKVKIGRIRIYQSRNAQYFPGGYWALDSTATFDGFAVIDEDHVRYMSKNDVIENLNIVDYRPEKVKTGSDHNITSTSATDIPDLSIALEANKTYTVTIYLKLNTSNTGGAYYALAAPAGTTIDGGSVSYNTSAVGNFNFRRVVSAINTLSTAAMGTYSGSTASIQITASITTAGTAGDFKAQLAIVVGGETMTIGTGSWMRISEDQ